jgi:acyl-CoA reductase-like NAD-dependent aldehyde dehydrogenase
VLIIIINNILFSLFYIGKKKVSLELGGNASCVVDADADFDYAVSRVIFGAFYSNGMRK